MILTHLYIYPIKSLGGYRVSEARLTDRGLEYDRRWLLIDQQGHFMTQRKHHEMALLQVNISEGILSVSHKTQTMKPLSFSVDTYTDTLVQTQVWDDTVLGFEVSAQANAWFTEALDKPCRLLYMAAGHQRKVEEKYALNEDITSYSDGYPILIIGQESLQDLNSRLNEAVPINRFRPNMVFEGGQAYEEDQWHEFWIGENQFFGVKPCGRCVMTTIDQQTGISGKEPLRTLSTYRKSGNKILFGQNVLIGTPEGILRVGEEIRLV